MLGCFNMFESQIDKPNDWVKFFNPTFGFVHIAMSQTWIETTQPL